jgi:hypothetical protein
MTTGTLNSTSTNANVGGGSPLNLGTTASTTVGFYGVTPVVQRPYSSAVHATSAASSSTDFGATQLAIVQEIMKTLIGLGIWATV